ncbi:hypothetical protein ACIQ7D_37125 [Streptomyces sp. NPDC096310]|uniref:hypothetical protein n=1 Tax=Streptomyces sp. NPDC096310 TaxID=3366082 RepID=UPI003830AFB8
MDLLDRRRLSPGLGELIRRHAAGHPAAEVPPDVALLLLGEAAAGAELHIVGVHLRLKDEHGRILLGLRHPCSKYAPDTRRAIDGILDGCLYAMAHCSQHRPPARELELSERRPAPTMLQMILGRRLQKPRTQANLTAQQACVHLRQAATTVTRMGRAEVTLKLRNRRRDAGPPPGHGAREA